MGDLVSVCIPTYNGADFLDDCINSVCAQTYKNIEILIVDDQSQDATLEIAQRHALQDPRIRIEVNPQNLGLVGNWNNCLQKARGQWIKFVFQDDFIRARCIEVMMGTAQSSGKPLVSCDRNFIFETGVDEATRLFYEKNRGDIAHFYATTPVISAEEAIDAALHRPGANFFGEPTVVLFHRDAVQCVGLFNPHLISACDFEYWTRIALHFGCAHVSEELATFRVHASAVSATNRTERYFRMDVLDHLLILHEHNYNPAYAPLRRQARLAQPPLDLNLVLWQRAYWARASAQAVARNQDDSFWKEWLSVVSAYPRLKYTIPRHFFSKIRSKATEILAKLRGAKQFQKFG